MSISLGCSGRLDCPGECEGCLHEELTEYEEPCGSCEHNPCRDDQWEIKGCFWTPKKGDMNAK